GSHSPTQQRDWHLIDLELKIEAGFNGRVVGTETMDIGLIFDFNNRHAPCPVWIHDRAENNCNPSLGQVFPVSDVFLHQLSFRFCHILGESRSRRDELAEKKTHDWIVVHLYNAGKGAAAEPLECARLLTSVTFLAQL